ncbi:RICIN domain-containing protein [Streptomyces sp. NPDC094438]|uniref:RICIN domain-containing protein n=1 Tax=Streptomyces sp. NPDC094438 TaxID=3366061 RepID=UPI00380A265F
MTTSRRLVSLTAAAGLAAGALFATTNASAVTRPAGTARPLTGFLVVSWMSNRCLDIRGGNTGNGASVAMWDCVGSSQQRWYWSGSSIVSDLNGKCLDVADGNGANGAVLNMWDCNGGQTWAWNGNQLVHGNKCLDISGANQWNGAAVQMWDCNGSPQQQWHVG